MNNFATSLAISILKISKDRRMSITDVIINAIDYHQLGYRDYLVLFMCANIRNFCLTLNAYVVIRFSF